MTENHQAPDRRPDTNRVRQVPRKQPGQGGIPPLRLPEPPGINLSPNRNSAEQPREKSREQPSPAFLGVSAASSQGGSSAAREVRDQDGVPRSPDPFPEIDSSKIDSSRIEANPIQHDSARLSRFRFASRWQFWGIALVLAFSGIGIFSAIVLLKLPALPNCPAIFWPTASASLRLYCAQTMANRRTVDELLRAISLVNSLPNDHPLRPEIDREIEEWSKEILALGEEAFQQGKLKDAIAIAKKVPANTATHQTVDKQIQAWKTRWAKAEGIYQDAENALQRQDLQQAFVISTKLLEVDNQYWKTTKYQELSTLIAATREDGTKLQKAKGLAKQGALANVLAAIKLAAEIKPDSYLYAEAQQAIADFGQNMLDLADAALGRRDYSQAMAITRQIPAEAKLQEQIKDFDTLAEAEAQAWGGTTDDLTSAIMQAQKLQIDRPLYGKAQQLVSDWQLEIQDVKHLEAARQLAEPGTLGDLTAAIAEAQQIPLGNPRAAEAQKAIDGWTASMQTIEDHPYLDRAEQFANSGDVNSLQAAINEASHIQPGRALSDQANQKIQSWTSQVQRIQDQPLLNQAEQLANQGDLTGAIDVARQIGAGRALYKDAQTAVKDWRSQVEQLQDQPYLSRARQLADQGSFAEAIATAQQIGSGRALYDQAQTDIRNWQTQTNGQTQIQQASDTASIGTPAMLSSAIQIADQVPANNPTRPEADQLINQWSQQILAIARSRSESSLQDAIAIAQTVPPNTEAYADAQQLIRAWQQDLGSGKQP